MLESRQRVSVRSHLISIVTSVNELKEFNLNGVIVISLALFDGVEFGTTLPVYTRSLCVAHTIFGNSARNLLVIENILPLIHLTYKYVFHGGLTQRKQWSNLIFRRRNIVLFIGSYDMTTSSSLGFGATKRENRKRLLHQLRWKCLRFWGKKLEGKL